MKAAIYVLAALMLTAIVAADCGENAAEVCTDKWIPGTWFTPGHYEQDCTCVQVGERGGFTSGKLGFWLMGSSDLFSTYNTYDQYLKAEVCSTREELEQDRLRLDMLEAMVRYGPDSDPVDLAKQAAIITCKRTGVPQVVGGLTCGCSDKDIALGMACR